MSMKDQIHYAIFTNSYKSALIDMESSTAEHSLSIPNTINGGNDFC